MERAHISSAVRRLLAKPTLRPGRYPIYVRDPLELTETCFFAHTDAVDPQKPNWKPYECPTRHADSYGVRPSDRQRSKLRMVYCNGSHAPLKPRGAGPDLFDWKNVPRDIHVLRPTVLGLFDCKSPHDQEFLRDGGFQHHFAIAQRDPQGGTLSNTTGGPMVAVHKSLVGTGSTVGWANFVRGPRGRAYEEATGVLMVELASRGIRTVRILLVRFGSYLNLGGMVDKKVRLHQIATILQLLDKVDKKCALPTIIITDMDYYGSGSSEKLLQRSLRFHFDSVNWIKQSYHRNRMWRSTTPVVPTEFLGREIRAPPPGSKFTDEPVANTLRRGAHTMMLAQLRLVYRAETKEKELHDQFKEGAEAFEDRLRNVPSSMRDAAGAIQKIVSDLPPVTPSGEPFSKRPTGRPVPRINGLDPEGSFEQVASQPPSHQSRPIPTGRLRAKRPPVRKIRTGDPRARMKNPSRKRSTGGPWSIPYNDR